MQSILGKLFHQYGTTEQEDKIVLHRIATNTGMLKKNFNKWQKKILLRIIDDKDLIAVQQANNSFVNGVRYGVIFIMEVFNEKGISVED